MHGIVSSLLTVFCRCLFFVFEIICNRLFVHQLFSFTTLDSTQEIFQTNQNKIGRTMKIIITTRKIRMNKEINNKKEDNDMITTNKI